MPDLAGVRAASDLLKWRFETSGEPLIGGGEGQLDKALNCVTNGLNLLNLGLEWRIATFETSVD